MAVRMLLVLFLVQTTLFGGFRLATTADTGAGEDCPCETKEQCLPVSSFPSKEVLGFMVSPDNYHKYDWTKLTTLAVFTEMTSQQLADLVCFAHSHNVRVVLHADYPAANLSDSNKRSNWVTGLLDQVQQGFLDGINIDFEQPIKKDSADVDYFTQLVKEAYTRFKSANSNYQVTLDVAWSPDGIDNRWYDYEALATCTDFLVIMAYDERSQIWTGPCIAGANSPYPGTIAGVKAYQQLSIPADKLVLGLPWYGYNYPCISLTQDRVCTIKRVPYQGAPCSDAAGTEKPFYEILLLLADSTSGRLFDVETASLYFMYNKNGSDFQVWYDDPLSLSLKYEYAKSEKLKGLAFWNVDSLDYTEVSGQLPEPTVKMWQAIET